MKVSSNSALQRRRFETAKEGISVEAVARDLIEKQHGRVVETPHGVRGLCVVCGNGNHSQAFSADREKNLWFCHACGEGGDVIELAYLSGFATRGEAVAWLGFTYGVDLPERPEAWFKKQSRQERLRLEMEEVRRNVLRRRLFKYLILPILEEIEDPAEQKLETDRAWRDMKRMPLKVGRNE